MPEPRRWVPAEPLSALVDGMAPMADTHMHVRIDLPGRLDPSRLQDATLALSKGLPALAGRYEPRWWRSRWVIDPDPRWPIDEHHAVTEAEAEDIERDLFALPFAPHTELPLRMVLLHMDGHDRLLLRVNHLLADGGGTKNLCYRLAAAYRGLAADPAFLPPPVIPPPFFLRAIRSMRWGMLPGAVRNFFHELAANRPMRRCLVPLRTEPGGPARYAALHLEAGRVARLSARWRPRGVTLNDLALAAFARAVVLAFPEANADSSHAVVIATADLRQYQPPIGDVCNYSVLRPLVVRRLPLPDAERTVGAVLSATRPWKDGQVGLLFAAPLTVLFHLLPHGWTRGFVPFVYSLVSARSASCVALTNIGPIDPAALDFGDGPALAARVATPTAHPPMMITAITGCAGALDFTVGYREGQLPREDADRLVAAMDRELSALE